MKNIMVVDDEVIIAKQLEEQLFDMGYGINESASCGAEAIEFAHRLRPDLILMDIVMPGKLDGIETAIIIKEELNIPVIFITSFADDLFIERAKKAEPYGYILKPFQENEIQAAVDIALYKKEMESRLNKSESKYRALMENAGDAILLLKPMGELTILEANKETEKLLGYSSEELTGMTYPQLIPPDEVERAYAILGKINQEKSVCSKESCFQRKDGKTVPVELTGAVIEYDGEHLIQAILRDITWRKKTEEAMRTANEQLERKVEERTAELVQTNTELEKEIIVREQAEKALRKSEKKYRDLVETLKEGICTGNRAGNITYVNPAVGSLLGYSVSEITGRKVSDFIHPADLPLFNETVKAVLSGHTETLEHRVLCKSGNIRWVRCSMQPVRSEGRITGFQSVSSDITQEKLYQKQYIQLERLAAIGQLAASVAHEINSPLQGITALLSVLKNTYEHDESLQKQLDLLKGAYFKISGTVQKLLNLSRPEEKIKQNVNVNKIIEDTIDLYRSYLKKKNVKVNLNLSGNVPDILTSPGQMGQVFINLVNNSVEAMGATLKPESRWKERTTADKEINIDTSLKKGEIVIKVSDNGPGISEEDIEHIFDPFYTKKKPLGMGIGLSICEKIIEGQKGTISAGNIPEGGAQFKITLPVK
ncbi:MAG TPA: PAS domain S-box protein [Spirochaetes bacterium]|nr:PAS domain S-box protein [Spirochaetota bacterium]